MPPLNMLLVDGEAVLPGVVRPKAQSRNRGAKTWRPFDFNDSSDDNLASPDDHPRAGPFDVHAKVFQPTPPPQQMSQPAYSTITSRAAGGYYHPQQSRDDDFHTVMGRHVRASGLNPYETKVVDKQHTVAAPYDKRELNEVFGNDLPGPDFCQAHTGFKNGQVQFCIHPNGDVSAQQWSITQFQWLNIGQFSNIRKRTEGQLASERLKGETELQSLRQNTLSYFRAIAKQREAAVMGMPFGLREIHACLPNLRLERGPSDMPNPDTYFERAPSGVNSQKAPFQRAASGMTNNDTSSSIEAQSDTDDDHLEFRQSSMSVADLGPHSRPATRTVATPRAKQLADSPKPSRGGKGLANLTFGALPILSRQLSGIEYGMQHPRAMTAGSHRAPTAESSHSAAESMIRTEEPKSSSEWSQYEAADQGEARRDSQFSGPARHQSSGSEKLLTAHRSGSSDPNRVAVKDLLNEIGNSASARGSSSARTVLHDPLQTLVAASTGVTGLQDPFNKLPAPYSPFHARSYKSAFGLTPGRVGPIERPPGLGLQTDLDADLRRNSELEPGWRVRPVEVYNVPTPRMSHEQLALYSKPTPQNFSGPFFAGTPDRNEGTSSGMKQKMQDEELNEWFTSGNKVQRQEEYFRRIVNANKLVSWTPSKAKTPGPIGRPSGQGTSEMAGKPEAPFDETITRLLIPVLENLSAYTQGPAEQRHGYFARFAPPPEWCIDKSPSGNNSFFGEDWGQPPERIGRDQRYRPLAYEGRFGSFEPTSHGSLAGGLSGLGALDARFRFGSGLR